MSDGWPPGNAYAVFNENGECVGHSGQEVVAERLAADRDERLPNEAPHEVREVPWDSDVLPDSKSGGKDDAD